MQEAASTQTNLLQINNTHANVGAKIINMAFASVGHAVAA